MDLIMETIPAFHESTCNYPAMDAITRSNFKASLHCPPPLSTPEADLIRTQRALEQRASWERCPSPLTISFFIDSTHAEATGSRRGKAVADIDAGASEVLAWLWTFSSYVRGHEAQRTSVKEGAAALTPRLEADVHLRRKRPSGRAVRERPLAFPPPNSPPPLPPPPD
jgi:hypothetical protein